MIILETDRLYLRELEESDLEKLYAIFSDPEVMKYIGTGITFEKEQARKSIDGWRKYQVNKGYSNWAVVNKENNLLIGKCGFNELPDKSDIEISYLLDKDSWGKGIATEIAKAALNYGFEELNLPRVVALVYPQNTASKKVIEKMGMKFEREAEFWNVMLLLYSKSNPLKNQ